MTFPLDSLSLTDQPIMQDRRDRNSFEGTNTAFASSISRRSQAAIGLSLAALILLLWLLVHLAGLLLLPPLWAVALSPVLVALQCWLSVGLFIAAHDAMHGSLAPFQARLNRVAGRVALMVYGAIWYDALVCRHLAHHRAPGTEDDPDSYRSGHPDFLRWYGAFLLEYVTFAQLGRLALICIFYLVLGVAFWRLFLFWALPAMLSSLQLFLFGTYLPHRRGEDPFEDDHRTRSAGFGYVLSLIICFHFGYHHEHHASPSTPWWRLPKERSTQASRLSGQRRAQPLMQTGCGNGTVITDARHIERTSTHG